MARSPRQHRFIAASARSSPGTNISFGFLSLQSTGRYSPPQRQCAAALIYLNTVGVEFAQRICTLSGADLRIAELVDDALARRPFGDDGLVSVGWHGAIAVGTLVAAEFHHARAVRAIDRAFFGTRALTPVSGDGIALRLRGSGEGSHQKCRQDRGAHGGKFVTIDRKIKGARCR